MAAALHMLMCGTSDHEHCRDRYSTLHAPSFCFSFVLLEASFLKVGIFSGDGVRVNMVDPQGMGGG